jgi:hypothetical protein
MCGAAVGFRKEVPKMKKETKQKPRDIKLLSAVTRVANKSAATIEDIDIL